MTVIKYALRKEGSAFAAGETDFRDSCGSLIDTNGCIVLSVVSGFATATINFERHALRKGDFILLFYDSNISVDSILDSVSNLVGVGKSAALEKENAKLKAENERIRKAFSDAVKNKVEELTKELVAEKLKAEAERDRALVQSRSLAIERDKAVKLLQEQQANEQQYIRQAVSQATAEKDKTIRLLESALAISRKLLNAFGDFLFHTNEIFKRAIQAIIHFGTEQHQSFFAPSEAADIKSVMQEYGETSEQQNMVGAWLCDYAESRQPFDEIKHRHTLNEVGDVAEGKYDWKIKNGQKVASILM